MILREAIRERRNYWAALASEAARPVIGAAAALYVRRRPSAPDTWRRGIILGDHHIGDVLYRSASLPALARGLPDCEWDYLAGPGSAAVLADNPYIARVLPLATSDDLRRIGTDTLAQLASERYDVAMCTHVTRYWPSTLLAKRLRIPNTVGFTHKGMSGLVTYRVPLRRLAPFPAYMREMVAAVTGLAPDWSLRPLVYPSAADDAAAERVWSRLGLGDSRVLACFTTSRQPAGVWPPSMFARVLRLVAAQVPDARIVLLGGPGDEGILTSVRDEAGVRASVLAGALDLLPLVRFLSRARAVLSTDSGPRHLANAARVPVVFVRNLSFSRVEAGAYVDSEFDMAPPELESIESDREAAAFASISVDDVAARVVKLIAGDS